MLPVKILITVRMRRFDLNLRWAHISEGALSDVVAKVWPLVRPSQVFGEQGNIYFKEQENKCLKMKAHGNKGNFGKQGT